MAFMVLLSIMMMGGLFLLLFGGVGFVQNKKFFPQRFAAFLGMRAILMEGSAMNNNKSNLTRKRASCSPPEDCFITLKKSRCALFCAPWQSAFPAG